MEQTREETTHHINIKAPEFMETAVNRWFTILEAQFHLRNVTASKTKFYTVISSLPAEEVANYQMLPSYHKTFLRKKYIQ